MTNSAFHKLLYEFNLNYKWNDAFRKYCDNSGIMYKDFYGEMTADTEDMKAARTLWKKNKRLWFLDSGDVDAWIDNMPFGDYKSEKDAIAVVINSRK